jgi:hypothetical protein
MKSALFFLASLSLSACAATTPMPQQVAPTPPTHTPTPPQTPIKHPAYIDIDPRVNNRLKQQAFVPVIIELKPITNSDHPQEQSAQIQQTQDSVLKQLSPNEFNLKRRYNTIFALSGSISKAGIAVLQTHPQVSKITLDGMNTIQQSQ